MNASPPRITVPPAERGTDGAADSGADRAADRAAVSATTKPPVWRQDDGAPVSCLEKIKVLNENYAELRQMTQDAFEDALLIGCSEAQVRAALHGLVDALRNPYPGTPDRPQDDC